jgi:hypothetical protein
MADVLISLFHTFDLELEDVQAALTVTREILRDNKTNLTGVQETMVGKRDTLDWMYDCLSGVSATRINYYLV